MSAMRQIATKPAPAAQRAVATATETRAEERGRTAAEIEVLAAESRSTDPAVGTVLTRLADAVRRGDRDEIHGYADAVDARVVAAATGTEALIKESQIRGLLGHATSLATSELPDTEADAILDAMAAEERRIYERAMEREQQLFDMEAAVSELRDAARTLASAAAQMAQRDEAKR